MDGWEFRRRQLADATIAHIPIIVVSALSPVHYLNLEPAAVIPKPCDFGRLIDVVGRFLKDPSSATALRAQHRRLSLHRTNLTHTRTNLEGLEAGFEPADPDHCLSAGTGVIGEDLVASVRLVRVADAGRGACRQRDEESRCDAVTDIHSWLLQRSGGRLRTAKRWGTERPPPRRVNASRQRRRRRPSRTGVVLCPCARRSRISVRLACRTASAVSR